MILQRNLLSYAAKTDKHLLTATRFSIVGLQNWEKKHKSR